MRVMDEAKKWYRQFLIGNSPFAITGVYRNAHLPGQVYAGSFLLPVGHQLNCPHGSIETFCLSSGFMENGKLN